MFSPSKTAEKFAEFHYCRLRKLHDDIEFVILAQAICKKVGEFFYVRAADKELTKENPFPRSRALLFKVGRLPFPTLPEPGMEVAIARIPYSSGEPCPAVDKGKAVR